jgi:hypothetical protein
VIGMPEIPGTPHPKQGTSRVDAWLGGHYSTMRLSRDVDAVRLPTAVGVASSKEPLGTGGATLGRWFAVGNVILTRTAYTDARTLPGTLIRVEWYVLKAGSIVNVGRCHPLFGQGGDEQIEFVSGPAPEAMSADAAWE